MEKKLYDLTDSQKSIYLTEEFYKNTNINNVCGVFYSNVKLNFDFFSQAINHVIKNNDSFKIRLILKDGFIKQYFENNSQIKFDLIELSSEKDLKKLENKIVSKPFNLYNSPLFKFILYKYPNGSGGYIFNSHHIITDSWSSGIIANEITTAYNSLNPKEPIIYKDSSLSYLNYIETEKEYIKSEKFQKDKAYWENIFETIPEVATIPSLSKEDVSLAYTAKRNLIELDKKTFSKIKAFSSENKISIFNLFMGVYALYLGNVSNQNNFAIGTPILNRTNIKEKQTTGMFINVLPLVFNLDYNKTFAEFVSEIGTKSMGLLRHQKYSYNYILEDLRKKDSSIPNLYNVMLSYQITKMNEESNILPHKTSWIFNESTLDDLDIHIFEWNDSDTIGIAYDYKTDKYTENEIDLIHDRILNILNQIFENKDIVLKDIEILTEKEKNQILNDFNNTDFNYPKDKTIIELFEDQVSKVPNNIALVFENQELTYKQLNTKVNKLANFLLEKGISELDNIGIFVERSIDTIIGILAILKINCTYIPIDLEYPETRINHMLEISKPKFILYTNKLPNFINIEKNFNTFIKVSSEIYETYLPISNKKFNYKPENNLYIIFTSGSTGKPKGVCINHKNIVNLIYFEINKTSLLDANSHHNILQFATMSFDVSYQEIFSSFLTGNTLVLVSDTTRKNIDELSKYIEKNNIDTLFIPPAYLKLLCNDENALKLLSKTLKNIITAGEKLTLTDGMRFLLKNNIKIHNHYGPAETHVATTFEIDKNYKDTNPPIGKPISNSKIYILDKNNNLCPNLSIGQIAIAGDCVGNGYFNNPEVTNKKFITCPFNNSKMYLTGDLGFFDNKGIVYFLGRNDFQVKINGFRIEIEEVDSAINSYPNIVNCVTICKQIKGTSQSLIAYFVSKKENEQIEDIREYLKNKLPNYMIPQYFVQLKELPFTTNGKLDRKALPEPNIEASTIIVSPRNSIDINLIEILENILHTKISSIETSFFDLGGDSLSAINLSAQILSKYNVQILVKEILENPKISQISDLISSKVKSDNTNSPTLTHTKLNSYYKLSAMQKSIYFASQQDLETNLSYNMPGYVIFDKIPDINKLNMCFDTLISRHESLRTYFEIQDGELVQKIYNNFGFKIETSNEKINSKDIDSEFKKFVKPFDLSKAPLIRAKFLKLDSKKAVLFVDIHHIVCDGTSLSIFIDELNKLYNGKKLEKIEFTYKDFSTWEAASLTNGYFKEAENYWLNQFKDNIPVLNLPTNFLRPAVKSYSGNKVYLNLDNEFANKINNLCKKLGITNYMLFLAAYYILLEKYTGQDEFVVGSPIVGRTLAQTYNIIGMFVNTLPMKATVDSNKTVKEFLNNIKNICFENFKYQDYPLNNIIEKLDIEKDTSRSPLFDTMFTYQNNGFKKLNFEEINSEFHIPDSGIAKFDLSLEVIPYDNQFCLSFEYCNKLFTKTFIEDLAKHYENIINCIAENEDSKIAQIDMLSATEKNKILNNFNNTNFDYPDDKTIIHLFEEQVRKTPDNLAITFKNKKLTYRQLNEKVNSLARYLRNNNVNRCDIVGIMVNRSLEMIISILAVLKAGAAYIPIDPEYPQDRIEYMLSNSNAKLLLTFETLKDKIKFENKIFVELTNKQIYSLSKSNLDKINYPCDPCYIIYTSGSTGKPKGVALKHEALTNLSLYLKNNVKFLNKSNKPKTIVSVTTVSFDIFLFETIISLTCGLKVVISTEEEQHMPDKLLKLIENNKIDIIQMTPSRMQIFLNNINVSKLKPLKYVVLAGEALPLDLVQNLKGLGIKQIFNGYGPSETTVFSSFTDVTNMNKITIGKPLGNTYTYILNKDLNLCPIGIPGELYIGGIGVFLGYLNNPELNGNVLSLNPFVENSGFIYKTGDLCKYLPDGQLDYLGRIDNQVKIRGLRIELGEIETKITNFPYVKKACVIKQTINNRDFLSAYLTVHRKINISELRKYISDYLPKYMVPSYFTILNDFPYTPNGKIDKKALPLPTGILQNSSEEYVKPSTPIQTKLVHIFEKVLNTKPIGINDNFFELGGDSILAMNLNIEIKKITDKISYSDIFTFPTIAKLEEKILSDDTNFEVNYLEANYDKYSEILANNQNIPKLLDVRYKKAGNILLTGATGFLGMHILDSFIKKERGKIYCIVRAENGISARMKLLQKLNYYFGHKYDKLLDKRIFAITGDVTKPGFGLDQEELLNISNNINIVINSAANVSHYGNYSSFYNVNVKSVKYMLDFCKSFNKKFYQISTLSVSGNSLETSTIEQKISKETIFDESNLYIEQSLDNVYVRSKFEAECLVLDYILDGTDAYILRLGNLMPRYSDGLFQENIETNAYINRILDFAKLGMMPDYLQNIYLELTPIDTTAKSIIKLITHSNKTNRIFHLFNHNHIFYDEFYDYLVKLNPEFSIVDESTFKQKLNTILNGKNKETLNSLINDLNKDLHLTYFTDIIIKSNTTIKYLEKIGFKWPKLSSRYLDKFINLLRKVL